MWKFRIYFLAKNRSPASKRVHFRLPQFRFVNQSYAIRPGISKQCICPFPGLPYLQPVRYPDKWGLCDSHNLKKWKKFGNKNDCIVHFATVKTAEKFRHSLEKCVNSGLLLLQKQILRPPKQVHFRILRFRFVNQSYTIRPASQNSTVCTFTGPCLQKERSSTKDAAARQG